MEKYSVYVLIILTMVYLVNQCDKYSLVATNSSMAQDIGYGDRECRAASINSTTSNSSLDHYCKDNQWMCDAGNSSTECSWHYLGTGNQYQLLAGPLFAVLNSISGLPMGLSVEMSAMNRKSFLAVCCILWSIVTAITALSTQYWHLAITRLLIGILTAACNPFATSIISDYFPEKYHGSALGLYNWGVYLGYSLSFILITADRELGWRWVYVITGVPGVIIGIIVLITVKEPRGKMKNTENLTSVYHKVETVKLAVRSMIKPVILLLCIGGSIRNGAGNLWAYNIKLFFDTYHPGTVIEAWMSWIPVVFGTVGAFGGGILSDKLAHSRGPSGRLLLLCLTLCISAVFQVGTLTLPMPWAFISHMPGYVFGEMWIGVLAAIVINLVPAEVQTTCMAAYFFLLDIIGGNLNLLVTPLTNALTLQWALVITFPGFYLLSVVFFAGALCLMNRSDMEVVVNREVDSTCGKSDEEKEQLLGV